jgi:hypothetical protein
VPRADIDQLLSTNYRLSATKNILKPFHHHLLWKRLCWLVTVLVASYECEFKENANSEVNHSWKSKTSKSTSCQPTYLCYAYRACVLSLTRLQFFVFIAVLTCIRPIAISFYDLQDFEIKSKVSTSWRIF